MNFNDIRIGGIAVAKDGTVYKILSAGYILT